MSDRPIIVWFRQDLRTRDQAALSAAAASGQPVLPLYVLDEDSPAEWRPGGATRWWLHGSLMTLAGDLARLGSPLLLRRGEVADVVAAVARESGASAVVATRQVESHWCAADARLRTTLATDNIRFQIFPGTTLFEPGSLRTKAGGSPKIFTPFWRACLGAEPPARPLRAPATLRPLSRPMACDALDAWGLLPTSPDWAGGLRASWRPGETAAQESFAGFLDRGLGRYHADRNALEPAATSQLSPHLHFGELSPREIWHTVFARMQADPGLVSGGESWLRELGWREFCAHTLAANPQMPSEPLHPRFAEFSWSQDVSNLRAWQRGRTGYPIVDAGMRQLWQTGWIPNRVRMIVASFLVKHLLLPWQQGEAWFWDTLVDADLGNNAGGWQWVAGCGLDAAPYFRIFNPVLQGEKFDSDGDYVRRWVPELARLPSRHLHRPWAAAPLDLVAAGVRLGLDYPWPLIDHAAARARALQAFDRLPA